MPLHHDQHVALHVFSRHKPGLALATNTQALALTVGVVHQTFMLADTAAIGRLHLTGLFG